MNSVFYVIEEAFGQAHDQITNRLILEHLLTRGSVTIEEAKFYKDFTEKVLHESSHLMIPTKEELMESIKSIELNESESKILMDPETGEKYIYNMTTGELVPTDDAADLDDDAAEDVEDADEDINDAAEDAEDAAEDVADAAEDVEDADEDVDDADEDIDDADEDIEGGEELVDSTLNENTKVEETKKESKEESKELNENEILIEKLLATLKN